MSKHVASVLLESKRCVAWLEKFYCKTVSVKPGDTYVCTNHQALRGQEVMVRVHIWINIVRMKRQYSFLCHRALWKFTHLFPPMGNSTLLADMLSPLSTSQTVPRNEFLDLLIFQETMGNEKTATSQIRIRSNSFP